MSAHTDQTDHITREMPPSYDELATIGRHELIERYALGPQRIDTRVFELDDELLNTAFLESAGVGKWPARILLGHLADCELLNTMRLRRTVAEDGPIFERFDPEPYIDNGLYEVNPREHGAESARAACGAFLATIHTVRAWTRDWLFSLDDGAWDRRAMHTTRGEFTLTRLLALTTWHIEYHAYFLTKKVDRLLGQGETPAE